MQLRDDVEATIRSWDAYERSRGTTPIIDYDCHPIEQRPEPAPSRIDVLHQLKSLADRSKADGAELRTRKRLRADITYLRALLGERLPLADYIEATQGCRADGWSQAYVASRGEMAQAAVESLGVQWGPDTLRDLSAQEGRLATEQAPDAIRFAAAELEPLVRKLADTDAPFHLTIESVDADVYWSYWLDGVGSEARLRLNLRRAQFTEVQARVFALHEVLGHALKGASYSARSSTADVPWVRLLSVHGPQQVLLEGLAQALPMFVVPDDEQAIARTRLAHFQQLVMSELHLAINKGTSIEECVQLARSQVPYWTAETIGDLLSDRVVNPQLRSYLWSYAAGIDWFVSLAEAGKETFSEVLRAAYREPLMPSDLERLWPEGPAIGSGELVAK